MNLAWKTVCCPSVSGPVRTGGGQRFTGQHLVITAGARVRRCDLGGAVSTSGESVGRHGHAGMPAGVDSAVRATECGRSVFAQRTGATGRGVAYLDLQPAGSVYAGSGLHLRKPLLGGRAGEGGALCRADRTGQREEACRDRLVWQRDLQGQCRSERLASIGFWLRSVCRACSFTASRRASLHRRFAAIPTRRSLIWGRIWRILRMRAAAVRGDGSDHHDR